MAPPWAAARLGLVAVAAFARPPRPAAGGGDGAMKAYVDAWATAGSEARCGTGRACGWMGHFGAIDVGCDFDVDRVGLALGSQPVAGPALSLTFFNGSSQVVTPGLGAGPFGARPALCVSRRRGRRGRWRGVRERPSSVVWLTMFSGLHYLFRNWPLLLNRLLYASDADLDVAVWVGDLPDALRAPEHPACPASGPIYSKSFYDGPKQASVSNHVLKIPAALAALAAPSVDGLVYADLDVLAAWPWEADTRAAAVAMHARGTPDLKFFRNDADKGRAAQKPLLWRVKSSKFYARDSPFARAFFADWFANRCSFKDQYALWHTVLASAAQHRCLNYTQEVFTDYDYYDLRERISTAVPRDLDLSCATVLARCPAWPWDVQERASCDLEAAAPAVLPNLNHTAVDGDATRAFPVAGAPDLDVVNAEFREGKDKRPHVSNLDYLRNLGIVDRDVARHRWGRDEARRR